MTWLARVASVASLVQRLRAGDRVPLARRGARAAAGCVIVALLAALTWINVVGVKQGARAAWRS